MPVCLFLYSGESMTVLQLRQKLRKMDLVRFLSCFMFAVAVLMAFEIMEINQTQDTTHSRIDGIEIMEINQTRDTTHSRIDGIEINQTRDTKHSRIDGIEINQTRGTSVLATIERYFAGVAPLS